MNKDRYNYDKLPISEETRKGTNFNVNDISILSRYFMIQDAAAEEEKDEILQSLSKVMEAVQDLRSEVAELKKSVDELAKEVAYLKQADSQRENDIGQLQKEVSGISKQMKKLNRRNSYMNIAIRIVGSISVALIIVRILHGPFLI